jgi:hypothetical protein
MGDARSDGGLFSISSGLGVLGGCRERPRSGTTNFRFGPNAEVASGGGRLIPHLPQYPRHFAQQESRAGLAGG